MRTELAVMSYPPYFQVWLNDGKSDQRSKVWATVAFNSGEPHNDYVLLRVPRDELPQAATPVLDTEVYQGSQYVLVGTSARSQEKDPSSVRHGSILSTRPDKNLHIKGDTAPEEGDSGGGCFLVSTGALFAICVARSGAQASLLPIMVPLTKVQELEDKEAGVRQ